MATRIGINGFGRIGRLAFRNIAERYAGKLEIVGINDLTDPQTNAHLLQWDSTYRRYPGSVAAGKDSLTVDGRTVKVSAEKEPAKIPWKEWGADIVIESTGFFTDATKAAAHRDAGARKVIISAPGKKEDFTVIIGVNEGDYDPSKHDIISNGSCTTNCIVPVAKVLHDAFGIVSGFMTTVHSYTNDQRLLDQFHKKDLRRARAAAANIIPTTTGAAKLIGRLMPDLEGVTDGIAIRVPTQVGSLCDFVAEVRHKTTVEEINAAFAKAASGALTGIIEYTDQPLVSSDIIANNASAIFDARSTMVIGHMVKVLAWYDNEWGYSSRLADAVAMVAEKG